MTDDVWSPVARRDPVTVPLECSGGKATATYRPWSAREQLAYEDAATTRIASETRDGDETVLLGTMKLVALALTLESVTGFPATIAVDDFDVELVPDPERGAGALRKVRKPIRREVPFDPKDERCLLALDRTTYRELLSHALDVQPLPGSERSADDAEPDTTGNGAAEPEADEDPSPTPPTPRAKPTASKKATD